MTPIDHELSPNAASLPTLVADFERHLCNAYAAFGDIAAALPRARVELGLSPIVGQSVIAHFTDAGAAVAAALGHTVSAHRTIDKVAGAIGIETATGDETPKPSNPAFYPGPTGAALPSAHRERASV